MAALTECEIDASVLLFYCDAFLVCHMLENDLLQPEECLLVIHLLTQLHHGSPHVVRVTPLTCIILLILHQEFNCENLLQTDSV